ncbi:MAG: enoyl-CoA hydratase/isomerase family protein [Alphaproteobacteria bacterium]
MSSDDIGFEVTDGVGLVTLNRPKALNAVTLEMVHALDAQLRAWEEDAAVLAVMIRSTSGRAFAAGGDIRRLYEAGRAGDPYTRDFFRDEYTLDWRIFHYPKPYVALMSGVTMGGGVGISIHGSHRVVTEATVFAMPETGIGFFPDVGATYFLPRLPGALGVYLAMTGARMGGADCVHAGIGTHYMPSERLPQLAASLVVPNFPADDLEAAHAAVTSAIERLSENAGTAPIEVYRGRIDACFAADSVEEMLDRLDADGSEWAAKTAATMRARSPLALKVALEQVRRGARLDLDSALALEYRVSQAFMAGHDFYEGVRATILDKDGAPRWQPGRLEDVTADMVAACFAPRDEELRFPPTGPGPHGPDAL